MSTEELPVKTYPMSNTPKSDKIEALTPPDALGRVAIGLARTLEAENNRFREGISDDAIDGGWTPKGMKEYVRQLESLIDRFCAAIVDNPLGVGIEHTKLQYLKREALEVKKKALFK